MWGIVYLLRKSVLTIQKVAMLKFNSVYKKCVWGIVFLVCNFVLTIQKMAMLTLNSAYENVCGALSF